VRNGVVGWLANRVAARAKAGSRLARRALVASFLAAALCAPASAGETGRATASAWPANAIVYGVDLFAFQPNAFTTLTAHLDDLARLGVNTLWLSPIAAAPPGDFGYAVTDPFQLRADFGSKDELHRLVAAAHARGMKIILDAVVNHLSDESSYFTSAGRSGRASPYYDYFERDAAGAAMHYFDWRNLENLNYRNPAVDRFIIAAFEHWLRDFDVDGFRVDAAWGPAWRDDAFLPQLTAALKRIKPDLLLIAEASARDPYYAKAGFAAAYDWSDQLGHWAWQDAFDHPDETAARLRAAIAANADSSALVFRFLENNDTGARFITRYGLPRTRLAAAMLLTLPGLPALYTGEEVGAAFEPYGAPPAIAWRAHPELRAWYVRLIALRRADPALRSRAIELLDLPHPEALLAYLRPGAQGDSVLVLLNYGAQPLSVALPPDIAASAALDLGDCKPAAVAASAPQIAIDGNSVRILGARDDPACRG
jgi:cyclomaltodextrinase / maltogenic alpha-amylase / neopullulanase